MERLEIHSLICKKDIDWFLKTIKLFKHYSELDYDTIIHDDGSLTDEDVILLNEKIENCKVIRRNFADEKINNFLVSHETCKHFRQSTHHTIFRIKLFDIFYFSDSNNILYMDSDILFCKKPTKLIELINNKIGFYLKDKWSSYCVPFRDEDNNSEIDRYINAGLNYYPNKSYYSLDLLESCLSTLYSHGSKYATHPFLEQTSIAFMISKLKKMGVNFHELPETEYCIPTFNKYLPEHGFTALHLNSSPLVGKWKKDHYDHELLKANIIV